MPQPTSYLCLRHPHTCVPPPHTGVYPSPTHKTKPRQNPVLLVPSRADNGSQSFSFHLGRHTHLGTISPQKKPRNRRDISRYVVPSNAADWQQRMEKNVAFEYPLADRPLQRSRYGRCTQKAMRKESAAATHRHTLSLAPNSITLLRAQRLSHQGVASQHEKPNEGAGFFFLSLYFEGLFCTLSESLSGTSRPLMAFEETR